MGDAGDYCHFLCTCSAQQARENGVSRDDKPKAGEDVVDLEEWFGEAKPWDASVQRNLIQNRMVSGDKQGIHIHASWTIRGSACSYDNLWSLGRGRVFCDRVATTTGAVETASEAQYADMTKRDVRHTMENLESMVRMLFQQIRLQDTNALGAERVSFRFMSVKYHENGGNCVQRCRSLRTRASSIADSVAEIYLRIVCVDVKPSISEPLSR